MRTVLNFNKDWTFTLNGKSKKTDLPHTWNAKDGQTSRDYVRGRGVYTKIFPSYPGNVFIEINGANTRANVYINGEYVGSHTNGYGMFRFELTDKLTESENLIDISVDNSPDEFSYPQTADFTFYGGLYRDVKLICGVSDTHFALLDKSRTGLYITAKRNGNVFVKSAVEGDTAGLTKRFTVTDADGNTVAETVTAAGKEAAKLFVESPRLWNGISSPYLYTLTAELIKNGEVIDKVRDRFGFRDYSFDSEKGFFLNDSHMKIKGVSRHQDREGKGNALTKKEHAEDIDFICELGANSVRLAHYQHSEDFYSLCDEKGLLAWAEIPVISRYSAKKQPQAREMLEELIRQNYNHPSIYCWSIENEISMGAVTPSLLGGIRELNEIAHLLDPTRPTACAQVAFCPNGSKLNRITDILGYNQYFGWYVRTSDEIDRWLDGFHAENPDIPLCLSEYGAEANTALHSAAPCQGDYSEEYQAVFHEKYLAAINEREWLWGSYVWNMFDFGSASRNEGGTTGRNCKGLMTMDRKIKKDAFWLYKAYWSDEKFVHVTGERFVNRPCGETEIKVYSNCESVTLDVNGKKTKLSGEKIFRFSAEIVPGENVITAVCGELSHSIRVNGVAEEDPSYKLKDGQASFVRNWFEPSDTTDPDRLSLNDTLGDIVNNGEVQQIIKNALGRSFTVPGLLGRLPLKPAASLLSKTEKGKDLTSMANQFLQSIKK